MRVLQVNLAYAPDLLDPERLLDRYQVLTGWSDGLVDAGASRVAVLQRFHRDVELERRGVAYGFVADDAGPSIGHGAWLGGIYRRARAWRPDVVHVNGLNTAVQWWALRRYLPASTAIVIQDHAGREPSFPAEGLAAIRRTIARRAFAAADGFLFTAAALAQPWIAAGLIGSSHSVHEVPAAGTSFTPVPRDTARAATGTSGAPAIVWVGRLEAVKDPLTVLSGFSRATMELPDASLTMIHAGGALETTVRRTIAADPALRSRVRLIADVDRERMPQFLSGSDLFVLGSRHEACGLALVEALASGVWPVVPDIPAFRTITGNGVSGTLWTASDAGSLSGALVMAARQRTGQQTRLRAWFERHLSWSAVGRKALEAYEQIYRRLS